MTLVHNAESAAALNLPPLDIIFGKTAAMQAVRNKLERVAETDVPVLIQGESGTGKEICVRLLHAFSMRARGSLVKVSCPAIPHSLLETELFGYEKGAFTGAMSTKLGRVEQSHNGTLFLDEVGSLDLAVQSKLLQVLQDGTFVRVGGHEPRSIATRLVSASNSDLRNQVEDGTFRLDFLFRINAVTINLPPLRQRIADLPILIDYFIDYYAKVFHNTPELLSRSAVRLMQNYHWPGNIRQLENLIRSYVLIGSEEALVAELMPETPRGIVTEIDLSEPVSLKNITKKATQDLERQIILKVLQENSWNRQKTAKWLQISYRSLLYKLSEVGMPEVPPRPLRIPHLVKKEERTLKPALSSRTRIYRACSHYRWASTISPGPDSSFERTCFKATEAIAARNLRAESMSFAFIFLGPRQRKIKSGPPAKITSLNGRLCVESPASPDRSPDLTHLNRRL
jgi:two-component system response regulator AtoC